MKHSILPFAAASVLLVSLSAHAAPRDISIAYIQRLDWHSDYPECMECFTAHSGVPTEWSITHAAIDLDLLVSGEQDISTYDLGIITGHIYYSFTDPERMILEDFVNAGGILWFDDCGGVEVDNLPFGMEIDFGGDDLGNWGTCYGDLFTIHEPDHYLVNSVFDISASMMRNDVGMNQAQWFTPFLTIDAGYTLVISGQSEGTYTYSGPAVIATQVGMGKIVATAMDISCAMECVSYANGEMPLSDYYLVINMLGWVDSDGDTIWDRDEGAFDAVEPDSDGDTMPDSVDVDADGDTILDVAESGDSDPDTLPVDTDGDTLPDFIDLDSDGDTIDDGTEEYVDADGDTLFDADADGDTIPNRLDTDSDADASTDETEGTADVDGDTIPGFVDADDTDGPLGDTDGDGIPNGTDLCPDVYDPDQADADGDTIGDLCDDTPEPTEDASTDAPIDSPPDTTNPGCDLADCITACQAVGWGTGRCEGETCVCNDDADGSTGGPGASPSSGCGCMIAV